MGNKKILLLTAAGALFLMTASADAAYRCTWSDGVKACGSELGFAPSADGQTGGTSRDKGDPGDRGGDGGGGNGGNGGNGGEGSDGGDGGDGGQGGNCGPA